MTKFALATLSILSTLVAGEAMAQAPTPMKSAGIRSWADDQAAQLWIKRFRPDSPSAVIYQTYRIGQKSVTVFIGSSSACDNGPNSSTSTQFWSTCPMQVLTQEGIRSTTREIPSACFAVLDQQGDPDPNLNGPRTNYDGATGTITVSMLQNGAPVPECTKSISIN